MCFAVLHKFLNHHGSGGAPALGGVAEREIKEATVGGSVSVICAEHVTDGADAAETERCYHAPGAGEGGEDEVG